mmetsp:Transcript_32899/g.52463  ORF Transcript_32899/g.52463 Transcript_32899/m.52463 type:complete len:1055 (-) Transcript_32899:1159-4323(-)
MDVDGTFAAPDGEEFETRSGFEDYLLENGFLEFSMKVGELLIKRPGDINGEVFSLGNLENCEVVLVDYMDQITVENLVNCKVFIGAVRGSCFIRNCVGCTFTVACNQFRVLTSSDCTFFIHVSTDPVIERSRDLFFGKYNAERSSLLLKELFSKAGIDITDEGHWKAVFDFSHDDDEPTSYKLVTDNQPLVDVKTAGLSPLGLCKLRGIFWRFDADRDGALNFEEMNAYQMAIGSPDICTSAKEFCEMFEETDIEVDENGCINFANFVKLYTVQGEDDLHADFDKLGLDKAHVDKFSISPYFEDDDDSYAGDSGFEDDDEGDDVNSFDISACTTLLCVGARNRGVNLLKWFANYDPEKRASVPRATFETAFSALLLGLCAGSSEEFILNVERILDPPNLYKLCDMLADRKDPGRVRYYPLVLKSKSVPPKASVLNASFASGTGKELKEAGIPVHEYLSQVLQDNPGESFESIRLAVQAWKWSESGRLPTQVGGAWTSNGTFISLRNLRFALRAALGVDFSSDKLQLFAAMLEAEVESDLETRTRTRAEEDKRVEEEGERKTITVASFMRWVGSQRLAKSISRDKWLSEKNIKTRKMKASRWEHLQRALNGDLVALEWFCTANKDVLEAMLMEKQIIPEYAIKGEAKGRAHDFLNSPEGLSMIRKRAIHLVNRALSGVNSPSSGKLSSTAGSVLKQMEAAKAALITECTKHELEKLENGSQARVELLLQYSKERHQGTANSSFEDWVKERDVARKRKRKATRSWERSKKAGTVSVKRVALASDLANKVRELVHRTYKQQKDDGSGMMVCRSSRYAGLDPDHVISAFLKKKTDEELSKSPKSVEDFYKQAASLTAGEILVSQEEFAEHFQGILLSLTADPKSCEDALALLDPVAASQQKLTEYLMTKKGKARLDEMVAKSSKFEARECLRLEFEEKILEQAGFQTIEKDEEKTEIVKSAQESRRRKADADFRKWQKRKSLAARKAKMAKKKKEEEEKKAEAQRKRASVKEYKKWRKAAKKNKYYTYTRSEGGETKRTLKARIPSPAPGDRPDWVFE